MLPILYTQHKTHTHIDTRIHTHTHIHTHPELLSLYVVTPGAHNEANEMPPSLVQPEPLLKKSKSLEVREGERGGGGRGKEGGQRRGEV